MSAAATGWFLLQMLRVGTGVSLAAYGAYALLSVLAAHQWYHARKPVDPAWTPFVTILKPVRGVDADAYANFVSFCRLDYPADRYQLVFGALDASDSAIVLARRLQSEFPHIDIAVVTATHDTVRGHNLKVSNLIAMLPSAKHDLLVLCDSDMRVSPDYLRRIVAPFQNGSSAVSNSEHPVPSSQIPSPVSEELSDPEAGSPAGMEKTASKGVGLVTCPYRGYRVQSLAAALEAVGIGADFIPSTLVSRMLEGVTFALGSTIALPRAVLTELGGFEAMVDELADDFYLGNGAKLAGYKVVLSDYVVENVQGKETIRAMWARRLRWAKTVRSCRPAGYAGSFVTYGLPLSLIFLCAMGFALPGWQAVGAVTGIRIATALFISIFYTQDKNIVRYLPLLPLSDLLSFALYLASFGDSKIVWRGEKFRLLPGGKITRLDS